MIQEIRLLSRLDDRPASKRIGLIVLATDHTVEADFRRLVADDDFSVHVTRVSFANPTTPENLRAMQPRLAAAASLILPGDELDALVYGCTSASVVIGEDEITGVIAAVRPGVRLITPASAAIKALRASNVERISILTPYLRQTAEPMHDYFSTRGFQVEQLSCLNMEDDRDMARLPHEEIIRLAIASITPRTQALFIPCTALRAAQTVPDIERQTGIPVITSNLAAAWACLRQCGVAADPHSSSRLLTLAGPCIN